MISFRLALELLFVGASPVQAQTFSELPLTTDSIGQQAPAWDRVSFSSLPAFNTAVIGSSPALKHSQDSIVTLVEFGDYLQHS